MSLTDENFIGSLDQLQLNLFDRQIGGSSGISIYQYCMVLFWHNIKRGISPPPSASFSLSNPSLTNLEYIHPSELAQGLKKLLN